MTAQIYGQLRPDATYGEKQVYKKLKDNLPKEFCVYIECQIHNKRELRFPDFTVLTNYGVIVLEVKDYVDKPVDKCGKLWISSERELKNEDSINFNALFS